MKEYYRLTKPGMVYGNAMTALAAFVFAAGVAVSFPLLVATILGLSLSIAGACVVNNVMDRDIDVHMKRTQGRAIPNGRIPVRGALIFGAVLIVIGLGSLYFFTNLLTFLITLLGVFAYIALYTPAKRLTVHSTIIGAAAGAVPPVVGYVAVMNVLNETAVLLFIILVCWQMTHFFAIAIFRLEDYRNAKLPVMPVSMGILPTKVLMFVHAVLFAVAVYALYLVNTLGLIYTIPMTILTIGWVSIAGAGFFVQNDARWARKTFFYSLILLVGFSLAIALS
ncbi:MAG: protoheme IX farnesyltransferase [Parcubacteria bacterium C7867-008]|nr:MAG: protoheme IX farnesyltransferase [Parcubacteria bacterium C7867-008]